MTRPPTAGRRPPTAGPVRRGTIWAGGLVLAGAALTGCARDADRLDMDTPGRTLPVPATAAATEVSLGTTARGPALVDGAGHSLYLFEKDGANASTCEGDCLDMWPAVTTLEPPKAGLGVRAELLGSFTREDGGKQVSYAGHPLYRFVKDVSPGDAIGHDLADHGAEWYLVASSGERIPS
ncbi:hypothetical protein [Spirillospora sp. NPDC047279]|uniref:COG4315 family predicted lipoprotein n=1 Tax=Spirillospora sp. NPDC047279 TaxID=3155478 RepID=UPI0033DA831D